MEKLQFSLIKNEEKKTIKKLKKKFGDRDDRLAQDLITLKKMKNKKFNYLDS